MSIKADFDVIDPNVSSELPRDGHMTNMIAASRALPVGQIEAENFMNIKATVSAA